MTERARGLTIKDAEAYTLRPQSGDVFVLKTPHDLTISQRAYWTDMLRTALPKGTEFIILCSGVELQLMKPPHSHGNCEESSGEAPCGKED